MVEDNLLVSSTISESLVRKTFDLSLECLEKFGQMYQSIVRQYQEQGPSNRSVDTDQSEEQNTDTSRFWICNVVIINNMIKIVKLFQVYNFWETFLF